MGPEPDRRWRVVAEGAAGLAVSMGIGRFVYTPILPLMHAQAGLSAEFGSALATANYLGYLAGALLAIFVPALARSALAYRAGLIAVIVTVALMGATQSHAAWFALRLVAGLASALVFVIAVSAMLTRLRAHGEHLAGWGFGGVGAGIALSGVVVLIVRPAGTWREAWLASAALAVVLAVPAWGLRPEPAGAATALQRHGPDVRPHRWFGTLLASYTLEGIGYIIAGTFLVAAINQGAAAWVGTSAWVLAGLAAVPAAALWAGLGRRWSRPTLLLAALLIQAFGIALPVLVPGVAGALVSAALFGATFLGIASMVLALGAHLRYPRAVALLTMGYSVGQILGPVIVTPLLHDGYRVALLVAAGIVLAAAVAAAALQVRRPPHLLAPARDPQALARHG
ncbi:MAG: YbfB/YjiJ family MFS transporter [Streptosporangiaceae bacterium]